MTTYILEVQVHKTRTQYSSREVHCPEPSGYAHIGYLEVIFCNPDTVPLWIRAYCSGCVNGVRLVLREYNGEYLNIRKPYVSNINKLARANHTSGLLSTEEGNTLLGYFLELQVNMQLYNNSPCKEVGWSHLAYMKTICRDKKSAELEREEVLKRDKELRILTVIELQEQGYDTSSVSREGDSLRYIIREES